MRLGIRDTPDIVAASAAAANYHPNQHYVDNRLSRHKFAEGIQEQGHGNSNKETPSPIGDSDRYRKKQQQSLLSLAFAIDRLFRAEVTRPPASKEQGPYHA